jgi:tetratricopeptide (TPR) repeat protein
MMRIGFFLIAAIAVCGTPAAAGAKPLACGAGFTASAAERRPCHADFRHADFRPPSDFPGSALAAVARVRPPGNLWQVEDNVEAPEPGGKAAPDGPSDSTRPFLDELFHRLQASNDPQEARGIAGVIERFWLHSGSDTADLLMERAITAMQAKEFDLALTLLGRIIELEPSWAEAWNKRATLRFEMDDLNGSMEDIQKVLSLEPRHFGALSGMGMILQREGLEKRALQAFRRLLEIYPTMESVREITDKLAIQVEGRGI